MQAFKRDMSGKQNIQEGKKGKQRKYIGIKIWLFGFKNRELSGNWRTEKTGFSYK